MLSHNRQSKRCSQSHFTSKNAWINVCVFLGMSTTLPAPCVSWSMLNFCVWRKLNIRNKFCSSITQSKVWLSILEKIRKNWIHIGLILIKWNSLDVLLWNVPMSVSVKKAYEILNFVKMCKSNIAYVTHKLIF